MPSTYNRHRVTGGVCGGPPTWAPLLLVSWEQPTPQAHPLSQDAWHIPSLGRSVLGPRTGSRFPRSHSICPVSGWRDQATRRFGRWSLGSTVPSLAAVYCLDPVQRQSRDAQGPFQRSALRPTPEHLTSVDETARAPGKIVFVASFEMGPAFVST